MSPGCNLTPEPAYAPRTQYRDDDYVDYVVISLDAMVVARASVLFYYN